MDIFGFLAFMTWVQALLFIIGLGLVIFEMFHPGFGAPGAVGGILLFLGILFTAKSVWDAVVIILLLLLILGIALTFVLRSATKGRLSKILILSEAQKKAAGYVGTEDLDDFLGKEGIAITLLRPAGTADFDGIKLDVVSESAFIPRDTRLKIVKVEGRRIVVREIS